MMEGKIMTLKSPHRHKIDPSKIKTLDDVIQILRRVTMHVDDDGVKGIEHLIEKDDE